MADQHTKNWFIRTEAAPNGDITVSVARYQFEEGSAVPSGIDADQSTLVRAELPWWRRVILRETFDGNLRRVVDRAKQRAYQLNQQQQRAIRLIYDLGQRKDAND